MLMKSNLERTKSLKDSNTYFHHVTSFTIVFFEQIHSMYVFLLNTPKSILFENEILFLGDF